MSTFDKTNNVESDKELLEDINVQDEDKKKIQDEVDEDGIPELKGKMKNQIVKDEEEAYTLYCEYAHSKGFGVRKDKQYYFQGSSVIREKRFVCYRLGEKEERPRKANKASFSHKDTRSNCPAMVSFKSQTPNNPFMVDRFVMEHNHEMPKKGHLLRSAHSITIIKKLVIENMVNAGIKSTATYSYLIEEAGGDDVLGYSKKDCFNFIHQLMKSKVEVEDVQSVVNKFNNREASDTHLVDSSDKKAHPKIIFCHELLLVEEEASQKGKKKLIGSSGGICDTMMMLGESEEICDIMMMPGLSVKEYVIL
ncbi:hypothetical protein BC332_08027 [Capsicum chinense]|nr:hypothetical protein BC332_08027 [Capsicum chinense]